MRNSFSLLLLASLGLISCNPISTLTSLVNESTEAILCNAQAVECSTAAINENAQVIGASTVAIKENLKHLESASE